MRTLPWRAILLVVNANSMSAPAAGGVLPQPRGVMAHLAAARALLSEPCPALDRLAVELDPTFGVRGGPLNIAVISPKRLDNKTGTVPALARY